MKWIFPLALLLFVSCSKKETDLSSYDLGYAYMPLDSGQVKIYAVDSIAYNDNNNSVDTFHFLLKEIISGGVSGQFLPTHTEILRSVQTDTTKPWEIRNSSFLLLTDNNLQRIDENIRVVKLVFPIGNVLSWNGNAYNNLGRKNFVLQNMGQAFSNGSLVFQDCIVVQEALANNAVEEILVKSVYAKGIGLIDFTNHYINTQSTGRLGYKVRQKLIYYTKP